MLVAAIVIRILIVLGLLHRIFEYWLSLNPKLFLAMLGYPLWVVWYAGYVKIRKAKFDV